MSYNPDIHHRRSIRLKGYDYSQAGLYFVTICVRVGANGIRPHIFGDIVDGKMILNEYGKIAENEWLKTSELRKNIQLHQFVVMPNHFHAIIEITENDEISTVGAYCIRPNENIRPNEQRNENNNMDMGENDNMVAFNNMGVCNTPYGRHRKRLGRLCVDINPPFHDIWVFPFGNAIITNKSFAIETPTHVLPNTSKIIP